MAFQGLRYRRARGGHGRFDATNAIDADVSVVVSIDLDHQEILGETRSEIAYEKLGIARRGKPLFWGLANDPETTWQLNRCQKKRGFLAYTRASHFPEPPVPMPEWFATCAPILRDNFTLAWATLKLGLKLENLDLALKNFGKDSFAWPVSLVGRFTKLHVKGLPPIWLDVCHNPAAFATLAQSMKACFKEPVRVLVSILKDKQAPAMLAALQGVASPVVFFCLNDNDRAMPFEQAKALTVDAVYPDFKSAYRSFDLQGPVVVCGSFFAVGEALEAFSVDIQSRPLAGVAF